MNSTQKTHKSKLQLLATKNGSTNLPKNYQKTERNEEQNLDLIDKIKDFNWQDNLENSNIKFTFGQNIPQDSAQKFVQTPNSTLHQKVLTPIDLVNLSDLQNLQKKLNELKNDKTKLQLEIQNLQTKIQTQVENEAQKQTILHQKIAKQNWQNWQIDKQNQQLFNQFTKSQSDKLEILKQRVFWQKKTQEKTKKVEYIENKIIQLQNQIQILEIEKENLENQNQIWQKKWENKSQKTFQQQKLWRQSIEKIQRKFVLQIKEIEKKLFERERIWLISTVLIFGMLIILSFYLLS